MLPGLTVLRAASTVTRAVRLSAKYKKRLETEVVTTTGPAARDGAAPSKREVPVAASNARAFPPCVSSSRGVGSPRSGTTGRSHADRLSRVRPDRTRDDGRD